MQYPMQTASSPSVKVFWLDREGAIQRLQAAIKMLRIQHAEIVRAVLFGSLQRGDAVPGSDADVLVVVDSSDLPFRERAAAYPIEGVGVPVDLFVYTRAELDDMLNAGNGFVSRALAEGRELL